MDNASKLSFDVFCQILSNRVILAPIDIVAVLLACRLFNKWTTRHLIDSANAADGYPKCRSLLASFTCYCGFPCETHCTQCDKIMNSKNTAEFAVFRWSLRCRDHSFVGGSIVWKYVWRNRHGKTIRSLFADELAVLNNGPILWDKIKEYDPHHISLQNAPNAILQETAQSGNARRFNEGRARPNLASCILLPCPPSHQAPRQLSHFQR